MFDASQGTDWMNHVKVVPDPVDGKRSVFLGEKVAKDSHQMTFVKKEGFLTIPADYSGAVVLRELLVKLYAFSRKSSES